MRQRRTKARVHFDVSHPDRTTIGLTFESLAKEMGRNEVYVAALFYGQAKPSPADITVGILLPRSRLFLMQPRHCQRPSRWMNMPLRTKWDHTGGPIVVWEAAFLKTQVKPVSEQLSDY
jgi:hypothetical protein